MIKVLQVVGSLRLGGLETVAVNYFKHIDRKNYEFTYLVYDNEEGELEKTVKSLGGKIVRIDPPSDNYIKFIKNIRNVIREIGTLEIIHAHQSFNSGFVMLAAKLERVPIRISHSHTSINSKDISIIKKLYDFIMKFLIRQCSTNYIACSIDAGNYLFGKKFFSKFGKVILNSVKLENFYFDKKTREYMRRKLNIEGKLVIGHIGTLNDVKNQSFLLKIMKQVLEINPNLFLVLIGDGPNMKLLKNKTRQLGIQDYVLFLGLQENAEDFLMAMDIFVFPSKHEGLGIALIEAQISGLPCLVSDVIPQEAIINDKTKQLSLKLSEKSWASEIINCDVNSNRTTVSKILTNYSPESIMKELYKVYNQ